MRLSPNLPLYLPSVRLGSTVTSQNTKTCNTPLSNKTSKDYGYIVRQFALQPITFLP